MQGRKEYGNASRKFLLSLNYEVTSDLIEMMLDGVRPMYDVLKAATLIEAWAWLEITTPEMICGILLGLSERENAQFVRQLEEAKERKNYQIVVMDFSSLAAQQNLLLHTDGCLPQPFTQCKLLEAVDMFAECRSVHKEHQLV